MKRHAKKPSQMCDSRSPTPWTDIISGIRTSMSSGLPSLRKVVLNFRIGRSIFTHNKSIQGIWEDPHNAIKFSNNEATRWGKPRLIISFTRGSHRRRCRTFRHTFKWCRPSTSNNQATKARGPRRPRFGKAAGSEFCDPEHGFR